MFEPVEHERLTSFDEAVNGKIFYQDAWGHFDFANLWYWTDAAKDQAIRSLAQMYEYWAPAKDVTVAITGFSVSGDLGLMGGV